MKKSFIRRVRSAWPRCRLGVVHHGLCTTVSRLESRPALRLNESNKEQHTNMETTTSLAKIESNRRNALKSTGPRTVAGRAASRLNATKHGIFSKDVLVRGPSFKENGSAFAALHRRFREDLQPVGVTEEMLVDRIVTAHWRLKRTMRAESAA